MSPPAKYEGYVTWEAIHADCPVHAECCVDIHDIEVTREIKIAAHLLKMSVPAFMLMVVSERLKEARQLSPT